MIRTDRTYLPTDSKYPRTDPYSDRMLDQIKGLVKYQETYLDYVKNRDTKDTSALITERASTHGDFELNTELMQDMKGKMRHKTGSKFGDLEAYQQEALDMIVHKIGRILFGDPTTVDHWDDIAGYAKLVSSILSKNQRTEAERPPTAPTTASPLPPQPNTTSKPTRPSTASVKTLAQTALINSYNGPTYAENMEEAMKMAEDRAVRRTVDYTNGVVYKDG